MKYHDSRVNYQENECRKRIQTVIDQITSKAGDIVLHAYRDFLRYHAEIEDKFDENHFLINFTNGVYNLRFGTLRPATLNDSLTLSTGYNLPEYNDDVTHWIFRFFEKNLNLLILLIKMALGNTLFENGDVSRYAQTKPSNYLLNAPYNLIDRYSPEWQSLQGKTLVVGCSHDDKIVIDKDIVEKNICEWYTKSPYGHKHDLENSNLLCLNSLSLLSAIVKMI
ncbi:hypothetical protein BDK51DRAFT_34255 [Blyttiomyces helicus]|uniref:Bacteriophage/plasmid primase P4 C-terminal domain-containing protein n=1 Tax=Blyttiomyces helicus TaxID=388810 RepID=A0A4P9WQB6_9FUNG|nr:hypothetical protein BDK51DRAFT_34255 [Blyttiomyces helicus]|eukprot:RKO94782.1 hypothetical protein BDK51DRAFT_34255 [Blyttiomyces helicus]